MATMSPDSPEFKEIEERIRDDAKIINALMGEHFGDRKSAEMLAALGCWLGPLLHFMGPAYAEDWIDRLRRDVFSDQRAAD